MIIFHSITIKNFLSIGNVTQAIKLNTSDLSLVLGRNNDQGGEENGSGNGSGKSSFVNAISYALFGQAISNIKKDNLINNINKKNMLVTIDFEKDGKKYRIERGRKPNILKFFIDNTEQVVKIDDESQGDSRETQKDIESILNMSHDVFKNIIALNTYSEPFLSMRAGDQRAIIEQLLGITILSEKSESLKNKIKETKDLIQYENNKIESIKKSNDRINESIASLKLKQKAWNKKRNEDIDKIQKAIDNLSHVDINIELQNHESLKIYNEQKDKIDQLNKNIDSTSSSILKLEKNLVKYKNEIELLNSNKCYACEQKLSDHNHTSLKLSHESIINDTTIQIEELNTTLISFNNELSDIELNDKPKTFYDNLEQAYNHQTNLNTLENQLSSKNSEIDTYQDQIQELERTALQEINWDEINKLNTLKDHQEFLLKLLSNKDSFIRKKIIDQNLSYLNHRLTHYLELMGLPHSVSFQNDLSVEISQLGQDLDFHNLSRGEMNRVILATSFSFRDIWESLYQGINLLFIDEIIDNGMDTNGMESSLQVLKSMVRDRNKSIFLISHKDSLTTRVSNILKVTKTNGFTTYSE